MLCYFSFLQIKYQGSHATWKTLRILSFTFPGLKNAWNYNKNAWNLLKNYEKYGILTQNMENTCNL